MNTMTASRTNQALGARQCSGKTGVCPLCHGALAEDVSIHLASEQEGVGRPTFSLIKSLHPGWLEEDGACTECWSFYRNLVRLLNVSGSFDPRFRVAGPRHQSIAA
jgi:hypothetical protein